MRNKSGVVVTIGRLAASLVISVGASSVLGSAIAHAADPEANLSVVGTSESATDDGAAGSLGDPVPVAVGEVVMLRLKSVLPESTTISMNMIQVVPTGLAYVAGSARVSYQADTAPSFNPDFIGIQNEAQPTLTFPPSRIGFDAGTSTLSFDLDSVINNDGDLGDEFVIIEYSVVVLDLPSGQDGTAFVYSYDLVVDEGLPTEEIWQSEAMYLVVAEPSLEVSETFSPPAQARGGPSTLTITLENLAADGASAPVHDLRITDTVDDWLDVTAVTVEFNPAATTFGSAYVDDSVLTPGLAAGVSDEVDVSVSGLPVDGVATVVVTVVIDPDADPLLLPLTITNLVSVSGDSLSSDADPDDEDRQYTDGATADLTVFKTPVVALSTSVVSPTNAAPIAFTATFDENVTDFVAGDLAVTGPAGSTVTDFTEVDASTYAFTVSGMTADGDVSVTVPANVAINSDGRPNPASGIVVVTYDNTAPTFIGQANGSTIQQTTDPGRPDAIVTFAVTADDPAPIQQGFAGPTVLAAPAICAPASGSRFPIGTTGVTCTASDTAGNTATLVFQVLVIDDEAPVIGDVDDIEIQLGPGETTAAVMFAAPAATDNSGVVTVACDRTSGTTLPAGVVTITCTAEDPTGNAATSEFTVAVVSAAAPTTVPATTVPPTTVSPSTQPTFTAPEVAELPETGGDSGITLQVATMLFSAGIALVVLRTRRRRHHVG